MKTIKGFTIIELIIALAIIGILATVAMTLYKGQTYRAKRIDAINTLMSISLAEERYRSNNTTYGTLAQVWDGVATSSEGLYSLTISNLTANSYTITATALGTQANDASNSTSCTPLVFTYSNGSITRSPSVCWPS